MNPDFITKTCNPDEEEIVCSYKSKEPFGSRTSDECKKYANNPDYRYLVGHGSSFGGEEKYCFKKVSTSATTQNNDIKNPLIFENSYIIVGAVVIFGSIISLLILLLLRRKNAHQ
jgi:hypothetical protein